MKIEKDQLITLDDNKKYIITNEVTYNNDKYFLLAGVTEDERDINSEFLIAKEIVDAEGTYIEDVEDKELIQEIIKLMESEM